MANVYRCSFVGLTSEGVQLVNTLHYQTDLNSPDDSEPDISDVGDAVKNHLVAAYRACLPNVDTVQSLEAREEVAPGSSDIPTAHSTDVSAAGTFGTADTKLPLAQATIITLRTAAATRSGRGHIAMPSPRSTTTMGTDGRLVQSGTYWTNLQAFAALLDDDLSIGTISPVTVHPVIYSRTRRARGDSPWTFKVTRAFPRPEPHWLRSRMTAP